MILCNVSDLALLKNPIYSESTEMCSVLKWGSEITVLCLPNLISHFYTSKQYQCCSMLFPMIRRNRKDRVQ